MHDLIEKIKRFEKKRILVIGDLILDQYVIGSCLRISPEAPFPVLKVEEEKNIVGGAGNTANNLRCLGAEPFLISVVGSDIWGGLVKKELETLNIQHSLLLSEHNKTIRKERIFSQGQQAGPRIDRSDKINLAEEEKSFILNEFHKNLESSEVVVISDYAKGTLCPELLEEIIKISKKAGKIIIIDPRPENAPSYRGASFVTPNFKEACKIASLELDFNLENSKKLAKLLNEKMQSVVVLTLSELGILFFDGTNFNHFPTFKRGIRDVSGAGDSVVAALAFSLSNNLSIGESLSFANHVGGVVVEKPMTQPAFINEVVEDIKMHNGL